MSTPTHWQPARVQHSRTPMTSQNQTGGRTDDDSCRFQLEVHVDAEAVTRISAMIDRLRDKEGALQAGSIKDGLKKMLPIASAPFQGKGGVVQAENAIAHIESLKTALQQLSYCVESLHLEASNRLERLRLREDSPSVPDEILSKILLFAIPCSQDHVFHRDSVWQQILCAFQSAVTLLHVSKRFRLVAVHTPALWNRISDSMSPKVVDMCLGRSGVTPLEVFLNPFVRTSEKHIGRFDNFVRAISASSERWSAFILYGITSNESAGANMDHLSSIEEAFESLRAPQLKSLEIHIPKRISRAQSRVSTVPLRFCHVWNMPQLQFMVASQFVPQTFSTPTALRNLDLELGDHGESVLVMRETLNIEALHRFLASCPMLTDLRVDVAIVRWRSLGFSS